MEEASHASHSAGSSDIHALNTHKTNQLILIPFNSNHYILFVIVTVNWRWTFSWDCLCLDIYRIHFKCHCVSLIRWFFFNQYLYGLLKSYYIRPKPSCNRVFFYYCIDLYSAIHCEDKAKWLGHFTFKVHTSVLSNSIMK